MRVTGCTGERVALRAQRSASGPAGEVSRESGGVGTATHVLVVTTGLLGEWMLLGMEEIHVEMLVGSMLERSW